MEATSFQNGGMNYSIYGTVMKKAGLIAAELEADRFVAV